VWLLITYEKGAAGNLLWVKANILETEGFSFVVMCFSYFCTHISTLSMPLGPTVARFCAPSTGFRHHELTSLACSGYKCNS